MVELLPDEHDSYMKLGKKTSKGAELDSRKAAANNKDDSFGVVSVGNPVGANAML